MKTALDGIAANTARISQHADRFADNLILFGEHKKPVSSLKVVAAVQYKLDAAGKVVGVPVPVS